MTPKPKDKPKDRSNALTVVSWVIALFAIVMAWKVPTRDPGAPRRGWWDVPLDELVPWWGWALLFLAMVGVLLRYAWPVFRDYWRGRKAPDA